MAKLQTLHTIKTASKKFETGQSPLLIQASDFNQYVCKYRSPSLLFNEYIACCFLKAWKLPFVPFNFVIIDPTHAQGSSGNFHIPFNHLEYPSFGSRHLEFADDVNELVITKSRDRKFINRISNPIDLLKIGLFDLWVANDDRNFNNYNLILDTHDKSLIIRPIDHGSIFSTGRLGQELGQLTHEDSVILSDFSRVLFHNKAKKMPGIVRDLTEDFYICIKSCRKILKASINNIPDGWGLNKEQLENHIKSSIIDNKPWLTENVNLFRQNVELMLR